MIASDFFGKFTAVTRGLSVETLSDLISSIFLGFSVGAVAVQNPNTKVAIQGGTLAALVFGRRIKDFNNILLSWGFRQDIIEWLIEGTRYAVISISAYMALLLRKFFTIANGAEIASSFFLRGWIGLLLYWGVDVGPELSNKRSWTYLSVYAALGLLAFYLHSLWQAWDKKRALDEID